MGALMTATILVVEDYGDTRDGLAKVLAAEGFLPVVARNGKEALDYLRTHAPPSLILLDMLMPALDGWKFLEELRALDLHPRPSIIIITAVQVLGRDWALSQGCDGLLRKPVAMPELIAEIRRCLDT